MSNNGPQLRITASVCRFRWSVLPVILALIIALLPAAISAQPIPPGEVELDGTVEVLHEDRDAGSRYIYFLNTPAGERLEMIFGANAPALITGEQIRARGRRSNGVLALSSGGSVQTLAAPTVLPNTFGGQKTILILVNFYDKATQPYTVATAQSVMNTTSNFDQENSFTQTWLTGVTNSGAAADVAGWFTINQSYTVCDYSTTASLAEQAATAAGVNLSLYPRRVYAFPQNACTWWGLGSVGGNPSKAWVNGSFQLRVVGHEMGHNLGLYHSHSMSCDSATCSTSEYGDGWDIMGSSAYHFNAFQKERLGWLNYDVSPPITTVQSDGVYWLSPYEANTSDSKALKILKSIDSSGHITNYYVEYRAGLGFDAGAAAVVLHSATEGSGNTSYIWDLDQTTTTSDWVLNLGQSYSDPMAGVTITLLSQDSTGASVSVTFGGGGNVCVQSNPTVTLSPSSQTVAAGNSALYNMTLQNNDNAYCNASSFNLSATLASGLSASFGASSLNLAPGSSTSTSVQVASSGSLSAGSYNFTVKGTKSTATTYSGSANGVESVITSLNVAVSTDKTSYTRNQSVTITATVSSGSPVANAGVTFTITKADGSVVTANSTSGSNGTAVYRLRLKRQDPVGTYQVNAAASMSGISGSAATSFAVQ
jgi:gametolysin peptidase M11